MASSNSMSVIMWICDTSVLYILQPEMIIKWLCTKSFSVAVVLTYVFLSLQMALCCQSFLVRIVAAPRT